MSYILWMVRCIVAGILLQTLYFKFTAHPDSVYIFEKVGLGAIGRIGTGIAELIAGIMILMPKTSFYGGVFSFMIISGAILAHLTRLGIAVKGDGGTLFYLACIVFMGSVFLVWQQRPTKET